MTPGPRARGFLFVEDPHLASPWEGEGQIAYVAGVLGNHHAVPPPRGRLGEGHVPRGLALAVAAALIGSSGQKWRG